MATSEITTPSTPFDPASIPASTLHGYEIHADMTFAQAGAAFDEHLSCPVDALQARYVAFRTMRDLRTKTKALSKFFGPLKLRDIHIGYLREYQEVRFSNKRGLWAHPAGATKISAELGLLLRILKLGKAYSSTMEEYFRHLKADECEIRRNRNDSSESQGPGLSGRSFTGIRCLPSTLPSAPTSCALRQPLLVQRPDVHQESCHDRGIANDRCDGVVGKAPWHQDL